MSFPTVGILDNFNSYSAGALPSPWAIGFGDAQAAISDGSAHAAGWNGTGYSASYHTVLGSLTDTELYCTIVTPPSHFSGDGIFVTYRSQKVSGGGAPSGSQNGYSLNITGDGASGWRWNLTVIGGATLIANTAITLATGDKIGVSVVGSTHTVWYCPVSTGIWNSIGTATDSTYSSGWIGIEFHNQTGQTQTVIDDLGAGAPVAAGPVGMLITNLTNLDYWFGPLHLPASGTLTVDVTTQNSLYLTEDETTQAINYAYASGKISVFGAPVPFPRATGTPDVVHGDGSPEGSVYASEGTLYIRRDAAQVYQKTTTEQLTTGWTALGRYARAQAKMNGLGYTGETFERDAISTALAFTSGDCRATAVGLLAGDTVTNILFECSAAIQAVTTCKVGLFDKSGTLLASSANDTGNKATGIIAEALSTPYVVPVDGVYYLALIIQATTMGSVGAGASVTGKEGAIGSGVKGSIIKTSQSDIPSSLGSTQSDQPVWLGWN